MQPVLAEMIKRFRTAQDRAVAVLVGGLADRLGVRLPASNREWVGICCESGVYHIRRMDDIGVYAHGYGIELVLDDLAIDFDWGDAGEPDGFDAWRLWNFVLANGLPVPSAPSRLNFRVEPLQFDPRFVDRELPIDSSLLGVDAA